MMMFAISERCGLLSPMHVIAKRAFEEAMRKYPNERESLSDAYKILKAGTFDMPMALKSIFPSLDNFKYKKHLYVIDIGGNHLRLLAAIFFTSQKLFVKYIITHKEYDKLTERARKGKI